MKKILPLLSFLLLLVSCTTDIDQQLAGSRASAPGEKLVFQASVEGCGTPDTKVYADENMKVLWNADDRISIFNMNTFNWQFAFEGEDGDTAGGFEPVGEDEPGTDVGYVYAVYPYKAETALSTDGTVTTVLPAEQAYKAHSFGIGANTMVAVTDDQFLAFKNAGGYVELRLYGDNISVRRITIKGNNGEKIAGKAAITMPLGGVPEVTMDGSASDAVSIVCDKPVKIGASATDYTDFWLVLPPVTFTGGFEITVVDEMGGTYTKKTAKSFEVKRNTLDWMAPLKVEPTYDNEIIRFADDNFKAYCVENFDKNGDKEISKSEAAAVRTINVNTDNITSLQGIEYFTNLTTLYCRGTNRYNSELHITEYFGSLTSLDVSQNTALTSLWCGGNQLTSLDVSHNTALTDLRCYNNPLGSLDITKNTALTILYCQRNQLTELDVSHNPALTKIQCLDNQLTSLSVGDKTVLTVLQCQNNQLTALDVSKNTALAELYCYNNHLTSLEVGDNSVLTKLDCYNNQLTALDVSKNTALAELTCRYNQLTSLNVSGATALTKLSCEYNKLITIDLQNNPQLSYCNTWNNPSLLEIWLKVNQTIATFYYDYSVTLRYTGDDTIIAFADANFKAYCLANFDYDQDGEITVAEGLSITTINVTTDNITSLQGIEHFSNLRYLTCNGTRNWNSALGQEEFLGSLVSLDVSQNTKLSNLYCPNNKLTSLDISHNAGLVYLTCNHNQLTSLDVKNNPELNGLDCSDNPLSSLNIRNNANLVSLSCDNNQLTGLDLSLNTELSHLTCNNNQLSILDVSHNPKMSFIQCSGNQLTSLDLGSNPLLTSINCCSNQLTTLNLVNNTALTSIQCDYNRMTGLNVSTCAELTMLYCSHNLLTTLDVSHNLKLESLSCYSNPSLLEIWLKTGQTIPSLFQYDENVADIKYKD